MERCRSGLVSGWASRARLFPPSSNEGQDVSPAPRDLSRFHLYKASLSLKAENLHLETSGPPEAPPVLLLHGWGSSAHLMHPIALGLADRYRVFNLDLPGHGRSPLPEAAPGIPEQAALVAERIRQEMTPPVSVVGHSNGGRIALYLACEPDTAPLIKRLVLISPAGITPVRNWTFYAKRTLARALKAPFALLPAPLADPCLDWLRHSLLWRMLGSSDYRALEGVMRETFVRTVNFYLDDRVHRITVPTLLFWGDRDTAISLQQMRFLESTLPDAGLVILKDAGHYGYLDDPDTFMAATRYFLENSAT